MSVRNHELYHEQDLRVPMTHLNLVFHGAGIQQEPESMCGLARFTAKMLFRGAGSLTREEISRRFDLLGAEVSAHVSETDFLVAVSCITKNLDAVLDLLVTVLNEASFPGAELELLKKSELNVLEGAFQDPERVLSAAHLYVLYDGRNLGKIGSRGGIDKISRKDLVDYFRSVRSASVLYFTAISDLSRSGVEHAVERFTIGRLSEGFSLKGELPFKESAARAAYIVESKEAKNDRLIWSQEGISATDEKRFGLNLIIDALGSFEGYLFDELRNKKGWCYGAYAFVTPATNRPGRIGFYADPSSESSKDLIPALLQLLESFPDEEGFRNRLKERNEAFKNRYAYQLDLKYRLGSRVHKDRYGIPILSRDEYNARIDGVTAEAARRIIGEVFDLNRLVMVFHGDVDRIKSTLTGLDASIPVTVLEKDLLVA